MDKKFPKNKLISRQQVERNYDLPVRFLEECARKTKLTGEITGPVFYHFENTIRYKVQHIEEYIEKNKIDNSTAQNFEKKCEKNKEICKKYNFVKKKIKAPQDPQISQEQPFTIEKRKKKLS